MDKTEKWLDLIQELLVLGLKFVVIILVITQLLFLLPGMGTRFNIALHLEGEPLQEQIKQEQAGNIALTPWTSLTLQLLDYNSRADVEIEINGRSVGSFLRKEFSLAVKQGDLITIFNPPENLPVKVSVSKKTANIFMPELNAVVKGTGRMYFDAVVLK
ncbi:MAG: hypothetical protein PHS83_00710 [Clostridia bacterium]|jgi:hypothetical protein|nr:hypothetical protein [Clostridia bacterium]MDD4145620.1 hypothetical protein [Clostridia bacterium]MDD4665565.1 hypothetical protein [Clostridia bacterium]